jgi:hypothetical protein
MDNALLTRKLARNRHLLLNEPASRSDRYFAAMLAHTLQSTGDTLLAIAEFDHALSLDRAGDDEGAHRGAGIQGFNEIDTEALLLGKAECFLDMGWPDAAEHVLREVRSLDSMGRYGAWVTAVASKLAVA